MFSQKRFWVFLTLLYFGFLLSISAVAQTAPVPAPVIVDFSPKTIPQGGMLTITGQNLPENVQFTNLLNQANGTAMGQAGDNDTQLLVRIPPALPIGDYTITVTGPNGSDDSTDNSGQKFISVSSSKIVPPSYIIPEPPVLFGVSTLGELIGEIFNYSFQIL